jgi:TonB family protein
MDRLFATPPRDPRSNAGVAASVGLHLAVVVAVVALGARVTSTPVSPRRSITFINAVALAPPIEPVVIPRSKRVVPVEKPHIDVARAPAPIKSQPVPDPPRSEATRPDPPETRVAAVAAAAPAEARVEPIVGAFDRVAASPSRTMTGVVRPAGFGAADAPVLRAASDVVARPAGFDREVAPRTSITMAPPVAAAISTPVEVLFKPSADYTHEARAMGIEGEVVLEVAFGASGDVSIVRIVNRLGHGLDETAARAVAGIRFRPATRDGVPVAVRTLVHIEFRLT